MFADWNRESAAHDRDGRAHRSPGLGQDSGGTGTSDDSAYLRAPTPGTGPTSAPGCTGTGLGRNRHRRDSRATVSQRPASTESAARPGRCANPVRNKADCATTYFPAGACATGHGASQRDASLSKPLICHRVRGRRRPQRPSCATVCLTWAEKSAGRAARVTAVRGSLATSSVGASRQVASHAPRPPSTDGRRSATTATAWCYVPADHLEQLAPSLQVLSQSHAYDDPAADSLSRIGA